MARTMIAALIGFGVALWAAGARPLAAQVAWDAPLLLAPGAPGGLSVLLIDPSGPGGPGADGVGVVGIWRRSAAPIGLGVRLGLAEDPGDDVAVLAGLDVSGTLITPSDELPVGFIWVLGAGVSAGDDILLSFPAAVSAGADVDADGVLLRPYVTPRVSLDVWSGQGDSLDLAGGVDFGLDLAFTPSWVIRFALSLGDREAIAVGLTFPGASF